MGYTSQQEHAGSLMQQERKTNLDRRKMHLEAWRICETGNLSWISRTIPQFLKKIPTGHFFLMKCSKISRSQWLQSGSRTWLNRNNNNNGTSVGSCPGARILLYYAKQRWRLTTDCKGSHNYHSNVTGQTKVTDLAEGGKNTKKGHPPPTHTGPRAWVRLSLDQDQKHKTTGP